MKLLAALFVFLTGGYVWKQAVTARNINDLPVAELQESLLALRQAEPATGTCRRERFHTKTTRHREHSWLFRVRQRPTRRGRCGNNLHRNADHLLGRALG